MSEIELPSSEIELPSSDIMEEETDTNIELPTTTNDVKETLLPAVSDITPEVILSEVKMDELYFDGLVKASDRKPTVGQFLKFIEDHTNLCDEEKKVLAVNHLKSFDEDDLEHISRNDWPSLKRLLFDQYRCQLTLKQKIELRRNLIQGNNESVQEFHDRCIKAQYILCDDMIEYISERDIVMNYVCGLKSQIYYKFISSPDEISDTLDLCLKRAIDIEETQENGKMLFMLKQKKRDNINKSPSLKKQKTQSTTKTKPKHEMVKIKKEPSYLDEYDDSMNNDYGMDYEDQDDYDYKLPLPLNMQMNSVAPNSDNSGDNYFYSERKNSKNGHHFENTSITKTTTSTTSNNKGNNKEFPCYFKLCNKAFISEICLKKHLILFHNQEQEEGDEDIVFDECDLCDPKVRFTTKAGLRTHMKVKHPEQHSASLEITNKEYCNLCPPEKSKYNLLDPLGMAMHKNFTHPKADPNNPTNLLCHTCEQSFSKKDTLRIHIKMAHFNLKVPQCDVCSKLFSSEHGLTYHWKVAVCKREPIPCGDCNETFLSKIELKVHRSKVHPVVKQLVPWPCHICEYFLFYKIFKIYYYFLSKKIIHPIFHNNL